MTGYMRVLKKVADGTVRRNRKGADTLQNRRFKSLVGAKEWFRVDREEEDAWEIMPPWDRKGALAKKAAQPGGGTPGT